MYPALSYPNGSKYLLSYLDPPNLTKECHEQVRAQITFSEDLGIHRVKTIGGILFHVCILMPMSLKPGWRAHFMYK